MIQIFIINKACRSRTAHPFSLFVMSHVWTLGWAFWQEVRPLTDGEMRGSTRHDLSTDGPANKAKQGVSGEE